MIVFFRVLYIYFLLFVTVVIFYSGSVFPLKIHKEKFYTSFSGEVNFFFPGKILNKYEDNINDTNNDTAQFTQALELPNARFSLGYQFLKKLSIDLNIGFIHHSIKTKENIFNGLHVRYTTSFLNLDRIENFLFPYPYKYTEYPQVRDFLNESQIMNISLDMHMVPIYMGINFELFKKNNLKILLNSNIGLAILKTNSFVNFNFVEMTEKIRNDTTLKTQFEAWTSKIKNKQKEQEDKITNMPKKLFTSLANNVDNLDNISHDLDYKVIFKKKAQFYTSNGINIVRTFYPGVNLYLGIIVDYLFKLPSLEVEKFLAYNNQKLEKTIDDFLGIKYKNKSWDSNVKIDSHLVSLKFDLGVNFYL